MNINEQWIKWEPIKNLSGMYDIETIIDNADQFQIILTEWENENKKVLVDFNYTHAYRKTEELFRTTYSIQKWTFYKIENSEYIRWLSKESAGISDGYDLIHFAFATPNYFLDVIASRNPEVKFIEPK